MEGGEKEGEWRKKGREGARKRRITSGRTLLGSFIAYQPSSFPISPKTILDLHNSPKLMPHSQQLKYFSSDFSMTST